MHCADISVDGLVYVCDRTSDRLQVFTPDGKFQKEVFIAPDSLGDGSTWDIAFSRDAQQKYMYIADGRNQKLRIYDRQTMAELTNFGKGGHYPAQCYSHAQHRDRLEGQPLHDRNLSGAPRAAVHLQRNRTGAREAARRALARGQVDR